MEEITGFNQQIRRAKQTKQAPRPAVRTAVVTRPAAAARPAVRTAVVTRPAAAARPAVRTAVVTRPATAARPAVRTAVVTRPATAARPAVRTAVVTRPATATRPAQIRLTKTARPAAAARPIARQTKRIMPKQAVIKPSGQIIPVSKLTRVTRPAAVKAANPIQRSFMPVDLPYQTVTPASKPMRLVETNYTLPININMIEPPVDAGIQNYYGK